MSIREIPPGEWQVFLEEFSRQHRAWLTSVDRLGPGTDRHTEVLDRPLGWVTTDKVDRGIVGIQISFQQDSPASDAVHVDAPTRLRVEETPEGLTRALVIEDEHGERTRVRLRVPAPPGLLDGVAPGEL
jgi:hypothetical protein